MLHITRAEIDTKHGPAVITFHPARNGAPARLVINWMQPRTEGPALHSAQIEMGSTGHTGWADIQAGEVYTRVDMPAELITEARTIRGQLVELSRALKVGLESDYADPRRIYLGYAIAADRKAITTEFITEGHELWTASKAEIRQAGGPAAWTAANVADILAAHREWLEMAAQDKAKAAESTRRAELRHTRAQLAALEAGTITPAHVDLPGMGKPTKANARASLLAEIDRLDTEQRPIPSESDTPAPLHLASMSAKRPARKACAQPSLF